MKNYTFIVILLAIFFGVMAGLAGQMISRYYIDDDIFSFSLSREFDLLDSRSNFIIRDPRKVVVSHDAKIEETKNIIAPSFFKLFDLDLIANDYLVLSEPLALAMAVSSDAWMMTVLPQELNDKDDKEMLETLVLVDSDRKIYNISQLRIVNSEDLDLLFIKADGLVNTKIRNNISSQDLRPGISLLAFKGENKMSLASLVDHGYLSEVFQSESFNRQLSINTCEQFSNNSYIFNLAGDFVGITDDSGSFHSSLSLSVYWRAILNQVEEISRPYLGIEYLNLSNVKFLENNFSRGAMIHSINDDSPVNNHDIEVGDLISQINGLEINDNLDLSEYILSLNYGDEIRINYFRQNEELQARIILSKNYYDN